MVRKFFSYIIIAALTVFVVLGAAGCSSEKEDASQNMRPPDKVTFQLHWLPEEPVYWAAVDKGFWAEQNLEVKILRGAGSVDAVTKVAAKKADFGRADVGTVILAQANEGAKLKVVSGYQVTYPSVLVYRQSSGIKHPKDLEGKTIAGTANSTMWVFWPLFAQSAGIDQSKVQWKLTDASLTRAVFVNGDADAYPVSMFNIPQVEKVAGEPIGFFAYKDNGSSDRYGEVIFAHEDTIAQNPDLVRRFVTGYLKGLRYMLENPNEAAEIVKKHAPEIDTDTTVKSWQLLMENDMVTDDESRQNGLGWISEKKMAETIQKVSKVYSFKKDITPKAVYSNDFLPKEPVYPPKK